MIKFYYFSSALVSLVRPAVQAHVTGIRCHSSGSKEFHPPAVVVSIGMQRTTQRAIRGTPNTWRGLVL